MSHAALYRHFQGIDALAVEVAAHCFRDLASALTRTTAAVRPRARLRVGNETYVRWGLAHPGRYLFMTGALLAHQRHHAGFVEAARAAFDTLVAAVAARGVPNPTPVAHTVFAALHGLVDLTVKHRSIPAAAEPVDAQVDRLLDAIDAWIVPGGRARSRVAANRQSAVPK